MTLGIALLLFASVLLKPRLVCVCAQTARKDDLVKNDAAFFNNGSVLFVVERYTGDEDGITDFSFYYVLVSGTSNHNFLLTSEDSFDALWPFSLRHYPT